jgi:hypothetical protein
MKNRAAQILAVGIALTAVAAVQAQTRVLTADVPFRFHMGSTLMPEGVYVINENADGVVAWIKPPQDQGARPVLTCTVVGKERTAPMLVFHRVGPEYFLAEIWAAYGRTGRAIPRSPLEKELAQSGAAPSLAVVRVALHR